jgi:hypothetical protein
MRSTGYPGMAGKNSEEVKGERRRVIGIITIVALAVSLLNFLTYKRGIFL